MLRNVSFAVLAFLVLLTALPAALSAAGPDCPDGSLAAILGAPEETGGEAQFSPLDGAQNKACIFVCDPWYQTPMYRGSGVDCTAAQNSLASQVSGYAAANGVSLCNAGGALGYCGYTVHVTVTCHWDFVLGAYSKDGYGDIKCKDYC
jgi:hypothetical protein